MPSTLPTGRRWRRFANGGVAHLGELGILAVLRTGQFPPHAGVSFTNGRVTGRYAGVYYD
jgi:hypothetical protein